MVESELRGRSDKPHIVFGKYIKMWLVYNVGECGTSGEMLDNIVKAHNWTWGRDLTGKRVAHGEAIQEHADDSSE